MPHSPCGARSWSSSLVPGLHAQAVCEISDGCLWAVDSHNFASAGQRLWRFHTCPSFTAVVVSLSPQSTVDGVEACDSPASSGVEVVEAPAQQGSTAHVEKDGQDMEHP